MKKRKKSLLGILLACMMICLSVSQAMAEVEVDASSGVYDQVLFPGDSLINVALPIMKDEAEVVLDTPGIWKNMSEDTVYTASMSEDGASIVLSAAGNLLVVENGTSSSDNGLDDSDYHYKSAEDEEISVSQDKACYPAGETVRIKASQPGEGMVFTGWTTQSDDVYFADAFSEETTITMPETKATVTANYQEDPNVVDLNTVDPNAEDPNTVDPDEIDINEADPNVEDPNTIELPQDFGVEDGTIIIDPDGSGSSGDENTIDIPVVYSVTVSDGTVNNGATSGTFEPGTTVTVTANDRTQEGLAFNGWYVSSLNAVLDDPSAQTASFAMPDGDVTVSAQYSEAATEPVTEAATEPPTNENKVTVINGTIKDESGAVNIVQDTQESVVAEFGPDAQVTVVADDRSQEGMTFSGWYVEGENVTLDNALAEEASFSMPQSAVTISATYEELQTDSTPQDQPSDAAQIQDGQTPQDQPSDAAQTQDGQTPQDQLSSSAPQVADQAQQQPQPSADPAPQTYTVAVANGTLSSPEAVQDTADSSKWTVKENRQVVITANPNPEGQSFTGWQITDEQGNAVNPADIGIADVSSPSLTLAAVNRNLNFQAQYEGIQYKITVTDGTANYETAVSGTVVTITANEAPEGMEFDCWKADTGNVSLADSFNATTTFTMPTADVTVSASYKLKEYRLTVENGTGSQQTFHMGDAVTVASNYPASGKEFNEWAAVSGNVTFNDASRWQTSFQMPASDVTVRATYKDGPSTNDNVILDLVQGGEYYTGSTIKFTASGAGMDNTNPNPGDYRYRPSGYQIGNVTGSWQASPYTTSMSIKAAGEYTLKVTYSKDVYDGSAWVADGTSDTKSVSFRVIVKAAGVATGDETPIVMIVAIAAGAGILFLILLILFLKRRKEKE